MDVTPPARRGRAALAAALAAAATQWACPAYLLSGVGTDRGRQHALVSAEEKDARLRCQGKECGAIGVSRGYAVDHSVPAYWILLSAEALGSGVAFYDWSKVNGQPHDGTVPGATSAKATLLLGAGAVAAALAISDIVSGGFAASQGKFAPSYEPFRFEDKYDTATWNGMTVPLAVDDVVPSGAPEPPVKFSVRDAAERRGLQPGKLQQVTSGQLAVLDFKNTDPELSIEDVRYFTDVVRSAALKGAPTFGVITRENLLLLLQSSGKDLASCEGECEVDTGRRIGADVVIAGDIHKIGGSIKLSLRMYETRSGRLLGATQAEGANLEELDKNLSKAAVELASALGGGQ